jgi:hypothetical protein
MVKASELDEFLHAEHVEDGDIIELVGKARRVNAEESVFERTYVEIPVKLPNGQMKTWTPNKTSIRALAKVFGDDMDSWIGKKVQLTISKQNVRGEMKDVLYAQPCLAAEEKKKVQEILK